MDCGNYSCPRSKLFRSVDQVRWGKDHATYWLRLKRLRSQRPGIEPRLERHRPQTVMFRKQRCPFLTKAAWRKNEKCVNHRWSFEQQRRQPDFVCAIKRRHVPEQRRPRLTSNKCHGVDLCSEDRRRANTECGTFSGQRAWQRLLTSTSGDVR